MIKSRLVIALSLAALPLAGPAVAGPPATPIAIPAPPTGKGQIVFFRNNAMGLAISCAVNENGTKVSSLPPGQYFVLVAEPGKHSYMVSSEAKDVLTLEVEPDETQFAICKIKAGIMAGRPTLLPATEAIFREHPYKMVKDEKMSAMVRHADGSWSGASTASAAPAAAAATDAPAAAGSATDVPPAAADAAPPAAATPPASAPAS
jgi:hypothetical protein